VILINTTSGLNVFFRGSCQGSREKIRDQSQLSAFCRFLPGKITELCTARQDAHIRDSFTQNATGGTDRPQVWWPMSVLT